MPSVERRYRILGRIVALRTDRADFARLFDRGYRLFRIPDAPNPGRRPRAHLRIEVLWRRVPPRLETTAPAGRGRVRIRSTALPTSDSGIVFNLVKREILRIMPEYLFLHAAVAVKDGAAVLIAGPSGAGKTTLLLRLAGIGYAIYSDEYAPIRLSTGLVRPFPRAVSVKARGDGPAAAPRGEAFFTAAVRASLRRRAVPIRAIAFLDSVPAAAGESGYCVFIHSRETAGFLAELGAAARRITKMEGTPYDAVILPPPEGRAGRRRLLAALAARRDAVLNVLEKSAGRGTFGAVPEIRPLPPAEAVKRLLANRVDNAGPGGGARPGSTFFRACRILRGVSCLSVRPGAPASTAEALDAIWGGGRRSAGGEDR